MPSSMCVCVCVCVCVCMWTLFDWCVGISVYMCVRVSVCVRCSMAFSIYHRLKASAESPALRSSVKNVWRQLSGRRWRTELSAVNDIRREGFDPATLVVQQATSGRRICNQHHLSSALCEL